MRKWFLFVSLILALALALVACGGGDGNDAEPSGNDAEPVASVGDAAEGEPLFQGTCASCHGPDAKGLPNLGKDLTVSQFVSDNTDEELVAFIKVGRPATDPANTVGVDMPPKGGNPALDDDDLFDIVAYIRSIHE
jgi:disulfide bond formation protein DsbB